MCSFELFPTFNRNHDPSAASLSGAAMSRVCNDPREIEWVECKPPSYRQFQKIGDKVVGEVLWIAPD